MNTTLKLVSSSQIVWTPDGKGRCDASDLNGCDLGHVYDQRFTVVSERTGATRVFVLDHEERDGENELLFQVYRNVESSVVTITVFND
jgi:hypothetical protein